MTLPAWPSLQEYVADAHLLGFEFSYPRDFLPSIAWAHADIDAGGDGHGLSFLPALEVQRDLALSKPARGRLVPFARADNGDSLLCFDGDDQSVIYAINLGDKRPKAHRRPEAGYLQFLNAYRANLDLAPWSPPSNASCE